VRKCGSKIVLKRQHLLQIEMQWRGSLTKSSSGEKMWFKDCPEEASPAAN
jgi:hypothetical protein